MAAIAAASAAVTAISAASSHDRDMPALETATSGATAPVVLAQTATAGAGASAVTCSKCNQPMVKDMVYETCQEVTYCSIKCRRMNNHYCKRLHTKVDQFVTKPASRAANSSRMRRHRAPGILRGIRTQRAMELGCDEYLYRAEIHFAAMAPFGGRHCMRPPFRRHMAQLRP